jgi:hypothetical protein
MATVGMPPGPWTTTSTTTDEQQVRWGQLKRTFAVPEGVLLKRRERIRKRAAEIYAERLARGTPGSALGDWLQAEQELSLSLISPPATLA